MPLKFKCDICQSEIQVNFLNIGEEAECKNCGNKTIVPQNAEGSLGSPKREANISKFADDLTGKNLHLSHIETSENDKYENQNETSIVCAKCNSTQPINYKFCDQCGENLYSKELIIIGYCEKCNTEYSEDSKYCGEDGNKLIKKEIAKDDRAINKKQLEFSKNFVPCIHCGIKNNLLAREHQADFTCFNCGKDLKDTVLNLEDKQFHVSSQKDEIKKNDEITLADQTAGFGWGNFYIFMGFFQGGAALIFSVLGGIQTEYLPNRGVGLFISILGIGSAIGLLNRKRIGLYLVNTNLLIVLIIGLILLYSGTMQGVVSITISVLWIVYFQKRKNLFN